MFAWMLSHCDKWQTSSYLCLEIILLYRNSYYIQTIVGQGIYITLILWMSTQSIFGLWGLSVIQILQCRHRTICCIVPFPRLLWLVDWESWRSNLRLVDKVLRQSVLISASSFTARMLWENEQVGEIRSERILWATVFYLWKYGC